MRQRLNRFTFGQLDNFPKMSGEAGGQKVSRSQGTSRVRGAGKTLLELRHVYTIRFYFMQKVKACRSTHTLSRGRAQQLIHTLVIGGKKCPAQLSKHQIAKELFVFGPKGAYLTKPTLCFLINLLTSRIFNRLLSKSILRKLALTPPSAAGARTAALSSLCSLLNTVRTLKFFRVVPDLVKSGLQSNTGGDLSLGLLLEAQKVVQHWIFPIPTAAAS